MHFIFRTCRILSVFGTIFGLSMAVVTPAFADFPDRSLEFVAGYKPGGGHDTLLRSMAKVLTEESIVKVPINVINKPGGSSAVSMGYLNTKKGDGHYLMSITSSHLTTPLYADIGIDYADFTPIARLGVDPELLVVNASGTFPTMDDILKSDKVFNVGGSGTGSLEHIVAVQFGKKTGKKINYIPFQGDGEVVAALLSNQLDFIMTNPGAVLDYIKTGKFKALGISTESRIEALPAVPTFKEQNIDILLSLYRGVTAPADISDEAKQYWIDKMTELNASPAWKQKYLQPNSVVQAFIAGDDFKQYLKNMQAVYKTTLMELGLIK